MKGLRPKITVVPSIHSTSKLYYKPTVTKPVYKKVS